MLDFLLLILCVCIIVAVLLYLFYWNRLIGSLIGLAIRLLYWNHGSSSVWVDIGSIHFSLIAGRLLLKDVRYHSSNQTFKMVKVQLTWRYWIRRPTSEEDLNHARIGGENEKQSIRALACRIKISIQGFEWFLYNKTAAYDTIIAHMDPATTCRSESRGSEPRRSLQKTFSPADASSPFPPSTVPNSLQVPSAFRTGYSWLKRQLPSLDPKDLLPVALEVTKGAIVCGNPSTLNILVVDFKRVGGTYGIVQPRSKYDHYKQILNLKFQDALVRLMENEDYMGSMKATGEVVQETMQKSSKSARRASWLTYTGFAKLWRGLQLYQSMYKGKHQTHHTNFLRRPTKSNESDTPIGIDFSKFEYAIERKILEAPELDLSYYADVAGEVPQDQSPKGDVMLEPLDVGNGDLPPEWGMDIVVRGGFLRYGPWADRQRADLQRAFFPQTHQDIEPATYLAPGELRVWTCLKVFIELREDTTIHVPLREASKDWQWDGLVAVKRPKRREPASIHLSVGDSSSISYVMPMVAGPMGYEPLLEVHLDSVVVTSSLNDIQLVKAESCRIRGELPSPLRWNQERQWTFAVSFRQPNFYLLRDHINMVTDLVKDWTSGPLTDYNCFIPMVYVFEFEMYHYEINTYANDQNIIDKPLVKEENVILTIRGPRTRAQVRIPSNKFRPESTAISLSAELPNVGLNLSLPRWNTYALHAPKDGHSIGGADFLRIDGSYRYFSEAREGNMEQLKLRFTVRDVTFKALGWSTRYLMVMRDNYLGSFTHFSTLYEYLDKRRKGLPVGDPIQQKYRPGQSNPLLVEMEIALEDGLMILPAGLPGYEKPANNQQQTDGDIEIGAGLLMHIPEMQLHFRMHEYFMEMSLNIDTISATFERNCSEKVFYRKSAGGDKMHIDRIDITAQRLFGPQPRTSTYVCLWEIHMGRLTGMMSAFEYRILRAAGHVFRFTFADSLNAPAAEYLVPVDPDLTFVKFSLDGMHFSWLAGNATLEVALPRGFQLDNNDLPGKLHRKMTSVRLPEAVVRVLLKADSGRNDLVWLEAAEVLANVDVDIYSSPRGWRDSARLQAEFISTQDALTGRAKRMIDSVQTPGLPSPGLQVHGMYLPQPQVHHPKFRRHAVMRTHAEFSAEKKPTRSRRLSRLSHLSESEGDEDVSEVDRDARLAQSRSMTPLPPPIDDNDQNMSSGDESDDEDLTDSEFDSDWSELAEIEAKSISTEYYHSTRHFAAKVLKEQSTWDGSPFILARDCRPSEPNATEQAKAVEIEAGELPLSSWVLVEPENHVNTTVTRISTRRGLELWATPLLLPALGHFEDHLAKDNVGPDLRLEALMVAYLSNFPSGPECEQRTVVDISLDSATARFLQRVPAKDDSLGKWPENARPRPDRTGRMAAIDVSLQGLRFWGNNIQKTAHAPAIRRFTMATSGIALDLCGITEKRSAHSTSLHSDRSPALRLASVSVEGDPTQHKVDISWRRLHIELGHMLPQYIAATGVSLTPTFAGLSSLHSKRQLRERSSTERVVYQVLKLSSGKFIVDPLSTIQPSYLVQTGRPHKLRTDNTFKLLFHLRNCLWHQNDLELGTFYSPNYLNAPAPSGDIMRLLEFRLASLTLDPDMSNTSYSYTLGVIFPSSKNSSPTNPAPKDALLDLNHFSIQAGMNSVTIRDPASPSYSEFRLRSLVISGRVDKSNLYSDGGGQAIRTYFASAYLGEVSLTISPHLMLFAQQVLRVRTQYSAATTIKPGTEAKTKPDAKWAQVHITVGFRRLIIEAAAENLIFEFEVSGMQLESTILTKPVSDMEEKDQSMNHSIVFKDVFLRARSPGDVFKKDDQDVLASFTFLGGKGNAVMRQEPLSAMVLRAVAGLDEIKFNVPRSALRLYRFIEEWRADFLPGIEATLATLLSEVQKVPPKPRSPKISRAGSRSPDMEIHARVGSFGIYLQVMHGTWLSWEINQTLGYLKSSTKAAPLSSVQAFGIQLASHVISIASKPLSSSDAVPSNRVKLKLPALSLAGRFDGNYVHTIASVEFFQVKAKPSHWDTLLAVQQKFGQDFHDLVTLIGETRLKKSPTKLKPAASLLKYRGLFKMRGFRISLEGITSTVFLECEDIGGGVNNNIGLSWNVKLSDLAFSLAPRSSSTRDTSFNRNHRSAFVIIDLKMSAGPADSESVNEALQLMITKIHAVLQPSSIGQIGDFVDQIQTELLSRKEQRSPELAAFKEKTKSIMKTFGVKVAESQPEPRISWLNKYIIKVSVKNIGAAFPLSLEGDLELPQTGSVDSTVVRAFLFSIKHFTFGTQRGETGQAILKGFSFQFVSEFRQSVSADFSGENHVTRNRLLYPEMTAQARSTTSSSSRRVWICASVSGFVLDLDSSIPDYVFSLIDVYRQGKERVDRLTAGPPQDSIDAHISVIVPDVQYDEFPTSNILASFTFQSGQVHIRGGSPPGLLRRRTFSNSVREPSDDHGQFDSEIFKLPVVSVWAEYRASPTSRRLAAQPLEPSILMFKSTIHSSENTLRPALLPYLTDLVSHIDVRMRKISLRDSNRIPSSDAATSTAVTLQNPKGTDSTSSIHISFSLRIDQSRLQLTCQPDVNVIAGLHWDSGGFILNISPGARKVSFTGSVGGLTVGLKHGFLSEDCVRLDARNLSFSVTFAKLELEPDHSVSSVSLVLDTEFSGIARFSRFQDVLCFKAVWLDRIPMIAAQNHVAAKVTSKSTSPNGAPPTQEFSTAVLIRIRKVRLEVDLGQSISAITLDLQNAFMRTKLTEAFSEVSLSIEDVAIVARGNISGQANVPNCVFQTVRRMEGNTSHGESKMLDLSMTSGALSIVVESDNQRMLQYRADPLKIEIFDDWSLILPRIHREDRPLQLSFTVSGTEIVAAANVGSIPRLLAYVTKFKANLEAQQEGASRESKAFRVARSPKPTNPLSSVANAMINSARSRFKEAETGLSYVVRQHMSLRLNFLRLAVFPRSMNDPEMAQFTGNNVQARLDRIVHSDGLSAKRDLRLSFSSMTISKFSQLNQVAAASALPLDIKGSLVSLLAHAHEATIVGLPSMTMHMVSEETIEDLTKILTYDFHSEFVRREGMRDFEDIYISLNMSLYSWLTILRKNLSREMDQVQSNADWRITSPAMTSPRRRVPEPLKIGEDSLKEIDAMHPRPHTAHPSILGPRSGSAFEPLHVHDTVKSASLDAPSTMARSSPPEHGAPFSPIPFPLSSGTSNNPASSSFTSSASANSRPGVVYQPRKRHIERLTMRQLGEATPDVMHPFFMKKAGFNLEDSLPQYVNEYATVPLEQIMEALLQLYSKQLRAGNQADKLP